MLISEALDLALWHFQAGDLDAAAHLSEQAIAQAPDSAAAWHLLGNVRLQARALQAAADCFDRALALDPLLIEAHIDRGRVFKAQGDAARAIACYLRAQELDPESPVVHCNLGNLYLQENRLAEALASYRRAAELNPQWPELYCNFGLCYLAQQRLDEAAAAFRQAVGLKPDYAEAYYNLAIVLRDLGRSAEAAQANLHAVQLKPDCPEARVFQALELLLQADFARGWREYEWRWRLGQLRQRHFDQPRWQGEPLTGKTILLHDEQGLGDTLQFIRYAPLIQQRGARVVVEVNRRLLPILSSAKSIDTLIARGDPLPEFQFQSPLISVAAHFTTSLATIPAAVPYLSAAPHLVERWAERLQGVADFRIGINWQGRPGFGDWRKRNIPLPVFAHLAALPHVRLISLQRGPGREELQKLDPNNWPTASLPLDLGDNVDESHGAFMDTAAVMKNLHLVITSDTSIAHLAGALAVPVWLALPYTPDWRWLLERTDSPWYPTMRLFRQKQPGDWSSVFQQLTTALSELVTNRI